ncbi:MAG: flagellar biosynthetic protein FliQ [bacterium]|nr:flagellar biosynthetic protein FliQ [bacterium]
MSIELVVEIYREMLRTAALVAAPILGTAMMIGLSVSLVQTLTSINEQTLTFVPKIAGIAAVIGFLLPWILAQLMNFLRLILTHAPGLTLAG